MAHSQSTSNNVSRAKVLVADDDLDILSIVKQRLNHLGRVDIFEASDGEHALQIARRERPVLVVLDVMMPSMSGWEVCKSLREDPALQNTAILMLTGIGERLNEMTSPLYGADDYLDKPFDFKDFDAKIVALLAKAGVPTAAPAP